MAVPVPIEAHVFLKSDASPSIGRERIRLLETVAREGSITAGAKAAGLSYKAAWDALDAMARMFGAPLLTTKSGGASGGGSALTATGLRVIETFARMEAEMTRVVRTLEPGFADADQTPLDRQAGFLMRTSARNALRGIITSVTSDGIVSEIVLALQNALTLRAAVTAESVRELGLCPGRAAIALIKAPFSSIAREDADIPANANAIAGKVLSCRASTTHAEIVVDIGAGETLAANMSAQEARLLKLRPGSKVRAMFDAAHVIVAID